VTDTLPDSVELVPGSVAPDTGTYTHAGTELKWTVGNLTNNTGSRLVFKVMPFSVQTLLNYAMATAETPDANPADGYVITNITVTAPTLPRLGASPMPGNLQFQFSITDLNEQPYVIQASTNLVIWVPVYTNSAPTNTITTFSDSNAVDYPYRFYRVVLQ
jgi:hypothetical protein